MTIVSLPNTTFNILPARTTVDAYPHRVLLVGVMLTGSATTGTLVQNIGLGAEAALFGAQSHLAMMIRNFRRYNPITPIDAIGYTNSGGTAAAGTIAFNGTATASGSITVVIGSKVDHTYTVSVAAGDTATTVGTALVAAITADARACVAGVNTTGSVALTAVNKGTVGNNITLEVQGVPAGLTCTITGMASGATDPTITGLAGVIANIRYQGIVFPGNWDSAAISSIMADRLNVTNMLLDGVAIMCRAESFANLKDNWLAALNNPLVVGFGETLISRATLKGASHREFPDGIAAGFAAIRALRLTDNANIANYVIGTNNGRDQFGGRHTASLPYFNTPMNFLPLVTPGDGFRPQDIEVLNEACVSVIGNNIAGNTSIFGQVVTTYKTDSAGNPNKSFKFLEYVDTITQVREYFWSNCRAQYAQTRLTEGALVPGYTMANADSIKAYLVGLYADMAAQALVQDGEQALKYFKQNLVVTLDMEDGEVFADMVVPVVVQLRTIMANIRIAFNTNE